MDIETATATPRSPVSVSVVARGHTVVQDKPVTSTGKDEGMMASEYLLVGLLACQHSTLYKVAAKRRLDVKLARVHGDMQFVDGDISKIDLRFELAAGTASDDQIETLLRLTEKTCTISRALKVPVHFTYKRVAA